MMFLVLGYIACHHGDPLPVSEPSVEPASEQVSTPPPDAPDINLTEQGEADLNPPIEHDYRRLDVDQLREAFRYSSGRIWSSGGEDDQLSALSKTLGQPDFNERTHEVLEPTVLFAKFLSDAATDICVSPIPADFRFNGTHFFVYADPMEADMALVRENIAHLRLRFHGYRQPIDHPDHDSWVTLWTDLHAVQSEPLLAWFGFCIAMIQHPDFYAY